MRKTVLATTLCILFVMALLTLAGGGGTVLASIPADCSVDVTDSLNGWLTTITGTASLPADGCYRIEGTLLIEGRSHLTLDGNGATLRRMDPSIADYCRSNRCYSTTPHVRIHGSHNVEIRNLTIEGTNTVSPVGYPEQGKYIGQLEFEHGVAIESSAFITVSNVVVNAVYGDGVYIGPSLSIGIAILDVQVYRNGRVGIGPVHAERVLIDNAYIHNSHRSGIDMEPVSTGWVVRDVEVRSSYIRSRFAPIAARARGEVSGIWIHDNEIRSSYAPWLNADSLGYVRFLDWVVERNVTNPRGATNGATMRFSYVDNVTVRDNVSPAQVGRNMTGVDLRYTGGDISIVGNQFPGATTITRTISNTAVLTVTDNWLVVVTPTPMPTATPTVTPTDTPIPTPTMTPAPAIVECAEIWSQSGHLYCLLP